MLMCIALSDIIGSTVGILFLIVCCLILVVSIVAGVANLSVLFRYQRYNRKKTSLEMTGGDLARKLLDDKGLSDIQVKKASFIRAIIWGNSYSWRTKTVFLRRAVINKDSMTAQTLACQKVGLAVQHAEADPKFMARVKLAPVSILGPVAIVPMLLVGLALDIFVLNTIGVFSIIAVVLSFLVYLSSFVVTFLNLPIEKKAVEIARKYFRDYSIFNPQEQVKVDKMLDAYVLGYVCQCILAVLQIVKLILQVLMKFMNKTSD